MYINELNRITTVNIEAAVAGTQRGSGTFKEILDNVMADVIVPIVNNAGMIIGMSFNTKTDNIVQDNIEQKKFEIRYCCKPVMEWVLKSLELKADRKVIAEVIEDETGIKVVTDQGEVIEIETYRSVTNPYREPTITLPSEVDIPMTAVPDDDMKAVKSYLRNTYGHYLSGVDEDPTITVDEEQECLHVTNIHWGRKK